MEGLIKRLEQAEEGSRKLDAEIAEALGFPQAHFASAGISDVDGPDCFGGDAMWAGGGYSWSAPHYTTNLQDARNLVPEGCAWTVSESITHAGSAIVYGHDLHRDGDAATPALALCIAALRAREEG